MKKFKLLFYFCMLMGLYSCSTSKDCGCSSAYISIKDTVTIPEIHQHMEFNGVLHCLYLEEYKWVEVDTIWLECVNFNK